MSQPLLLGGLALCVLLALTSLLLALRQIRRRQQEQVDRRPMAGAGEERARFKLLGAILRPGDEEELAQLQSRTTRAGLYGQEAVDLFLTVRLILLAAAGGLSILAILWASTPMSAVMLAVMISGMAVVLPSMWLDRRAQARQAEVARDLPEVLDLMVLCLDAGMGLENALERVAGGRTGREEGLLRRELRQVLGDLRVGMSMEMAFRRFATRIGSDEANTLAVVISKAMALGTQISDLLRSHAKTLRQHQLMRLEETAGKASAKLTLPLTICLLPAGMLLLLGPAFFEVFSLL